MKESEQGRIREAAPSAGRGEGPRSGISLPSSFECPRQSAAHPLFGRGPTGWLAAFYPPECAVGAPARSVKCPRGCWFLPRVGTLGGQGGRRIPAPRLEGWCWQKLGKAKPENVGKP